MTEKTIERRSCRRFVMPGATLHYRKDASLLRKDFSEDLCPVIDISRGGVRFLSQDNLKVDTRVSLKITAPGEDMPVIIRGMVRWTIPNPEKSYKYQIGIQFSPFGEQRGQNDREILKRIAAWEERFTAGA